MKRRIDKAVVWALTLALILSLTLSLAACAGADGEENKSTAQDNNGEGESASVASQNENAGEQSGGGGNGGGDSNTGAFLFKETVTDTPEGSIVSGIDADASDFETGTLQLYIRNGTEKEIETGRAYSIQRDEGEWTTLPIEPGWTDDLLIVRPGEQITMNIDLCYDQYAYKKGAYRIERPDASWGPSFIEFTIGRDIRYDKDKRFLLLDLKDAVITYQGHGEYTLTEADERDVDLMTIINDARRARIAVPDTESYLQETQLLDGFTIRVPRYDVRTGKNDTEVTQEIIYERRSKQDLLYFQVYREDWGETADRDDLAGGDLYDLAHEEVYAVPDDYAVQYLRDLLERMKEATGAYEKDDGGEH
jgi:hypothetical protein